MVAVLASACLQAPPGVSDGDGGPGLPDATPNGIRFPPDGAKVHVSAAIAVDIDRDNRDDLVLCDDDTSDDWVGIYVLRASLAGWVALDEVALDFRPTAVRYGKEIRPGSALVVGGEAGRVAVVDLTTGGEYEVKELAFDMPVAGDITIVHTGVLVAGDPAASLIFSDGADLWRSSPIDENGLMLIQVLATGAVLDAAFWPLDSNDATNYVGARREDDAVWFDELGEPGEPGTTLPPVRAARFGHLLTGMCGTYLAVDAEQALSIGSISCSGVDASLAPVDGDDIPEITAMADGDIAGGGKRDVILIGRDGADVVGQVLIDIALEVVPSPLFVPAAVTPRLAIPGTPADVLLVVADVQADETGLIYAIAPEGSVFCGGVENEGAIPCEPQWEVTPP